VWGGGVERAVRCERFDAQFFAGREGVVAYNEIFRAEARLPVSSVLGKLGLYGHLQNTPGFIVKIALWFAATFAQRLSQVSFCLVTNRTVSMYAAIKS